MPARNLVEMETGYVNDSSKNHSWRSLQRIDFGIRPGLTNRLLFEQQFQHGFDDSFEAVETFNEELRWRLRESLLFSAGGGAVWFDNADVHAIYDTSLAFQPMRHLVLGAAFSRVPIIPDAEASEHRLTAQGWEVFSIWTPARWQINVHGSRQHYSDGNIGSRQSAEVSRELGTPRLTFELGYRYQHYGFDQELAHGYFSPNSYQSHLAMASVRFRPGRKYRGEFLVRSGLESPAAGSDFRAAWEIHARNEVLLGNWTLDLDYSKYHLVQETGAFRADAGRFAFTYHFSSRRSLVCYVLMRASSRRVMPIEILVVDDDKATRQWLCSVLDAEGYVCHAARNTQEAEDFLRRSEVQLALLDIYLGEVNGVEFLKRIKTIQPDCDCVMMTAHASVETMAQSVKDGAVEYLGKPLRIDDLLGLVRRLEKRRQSRNGHAVAGEPEPEGFAGTAIIGRSPKMLEVYRSIARVAPTDATVLIVGPSGSGKERVASAIHAHSKRASKPMTAINCGALDSRSNCCEFCRKGRYEG